MLGLALAFALNPAVTPAAIDATICVPGWAASVRPASSYTRAFERRALQAGADPRGFVVDHQLPISLGGAPRDPANLRLQAVAAAKAKDLDERRLHRAVCSGRMGLEAAQDELLRRWP